MTENKYIRTCSIWRALDIIGDKPTLLLIESYWLGTRRFSDFQKQTGLLKSVISDRLGKLIDAGCLEKVLYSERPKRHEYRATDKFYGLYPVALAMLKWEKKWNRKKGKIEITLIHKSCQHPTDPHLICKQCQSAVDPRQMSWAEGPGVGLMPAIYHRRRRKTSKDVVTPLFDEIVDIIGDRWSTLIIRSIFTNLNNFQDICDDTGIATNILTERLERLCALDVLEKKEGLYKLRPKGRDIYPILITLMDWGDAYYAEGAGPPLLLTHKPCGSELVSHMACDHCGETVRLGDVEFNFSAMSLS